MTLTEIFNAAGLNAREQQQMPEFLDWNDDFYDSSAFDKLYEYFAFETCEMPYDVCKARTECADEWILKYLEVLA